MAVAGVLTTFTGLVGLAMLAGAGAELADGRADSVFLLGFGSAFASLAYGSGGSAWRPTPKPAGARRPSPGSCPGSWPWPASWPAWPRSPSFGNGKGWVHRKDDRTPGTRVLISSRSRTG